MTSLLLVEDEEAIRQKLVYNVSWAEHGFDPVLSAGNGVEALKLIEQNPVDIMVTDIQMPKMNGIDLIREIQTRNHPMKIIIISGFAEFEYAQEAIKFNVSDYLLKPFASRKLLDIALRLKEKLEQECAEKSELYGLREQLRQNMDTLREKFFTDLINGNLAGTDINAKMSFLGLTELASLDGQVIVIEIPESQLRTASEEEKYLINLQFKQQLIRLLEGGIYRHRIINHQRNQMVVIFFAPDPNLAMRLEEYLVQLKMLLNQSLILGVGNRYRSLQDFSVSYQEACVAIQYSYLYGNDRVYSINDLHLDNPFYDKHFYSLYQNRIFNDLRIGANHLIREDLAALIAEMRQSQMSPQSLQILASNLLLLTYIILNELGYNPNEIFETDFSPLTMVNQAGNLNELEKILQNFFDRINQYIITKRSSLNQKLVDQIRQYIDQNYCEDITLSAIADQYNISTGYLSILFNERIGKKFIDYLTELRITKAKELLKHSDMRIYEISTAVGYKDSFYFSNCFKKIVGLTPSEYRDQFKESVQ